MDDLGLGPTSFLRPAEYPGVLVSLWMLGGSWRRRAGVMARDASKLLHRLPEESVPRSVEDASVPGPPHGAQEWGVTPLVLTGLCRDCASGLWFAGPAVQDEKGLDPHPCTAQRVVQRPPGQQAWMAV